MHAYLIIVIVICGLMFLFDGIMVAGSTDTPNKEQKAAAGACLLNLVPLTFAIVALAIALASR